MDYFTEVVLETFLFQDPFTPIKTEGAKKLLFM